MSFWQKLMQSILPKTSALDMEAKLELGVFNGQGDLTHSRTYSNCGQRGIYTLTYQKPYKDVGD